MAARQTIAQSTSHAAACVFRRVHLADVPLLRPHAARKVSGAVVCLAAAEWVHARAPTLRRNGRTARFCNSCSRVHPPEDSDEGHLTCRSLCDQKVPPQGQYVCVCSRGSGYAHAVVRQGPLRPGTGSFQASGLVTPPGIFVWLLAAHARHCPRLKTTGQVSPTALDGAASCTLPWHI